jgi:peptidoglycan hydrolase-like protein with peptidoglycan-binding domain
MSLRSRLFSGDAKLQAAATSNPAHIVPGALGEHVGKIQQALRLLDGDAIDPAELAAKRYGPSTAQAVLSYKTKHGIINRAYQTKPDNIVGIMTIASLDKGLLGIEQGPNSVKLTNCSWSSSATRG